MISRVAAAGGALCLAVAAILVASHSPAYARVEVLLPLLFFAHLVWYAATRARPQRRVVLGITAVLVALCAFAQPVAEDDYWRFLWDGYRTAIDASPYGRPPADWFGDAPLPPEMQRVLDGVNHPEVPTIYGPLLQALFAAAHALAPADPRGLAVIFGVLHLCCVALALRRMPAHLVALAAWNPLILQQCLMNLHPDFLLGWILLAAVFAARRNAAARLGVLLAVAATIKVSALVAAPALWIAASRTRPPMVFGLLRSAIAGALTFAVLYAPFLGAAGSESAGLMAFARDWTFNPALFAIIAWTLGDTTARWVAVSIVMVAALWSVRSITPRSVATAVVLSLAVLLVLSPVINPWYLAWMLPVATLTRWRTPWIAAAALSLSTLTAGELGLAGDPFALPPAVAAAQWLMVATAFVIDMRARCPRVRPAKGILDSSISRHRSRIFNHVA